MSASKQVSRISEPRLLLQLQVSSPSGPKEHTVEMDLMTLGALTKSMATIREQMNAAQ